ncbi:MAG: hypothetical protein NVS1B9_10310 [Solirubrobacteraceae bacterium]
MILLDAMGTLVGLRPPVPALVRLLGERHGSQVSERDATRALGIEMEHYRRECHRAGNARELALLRTECADLLAGELGLPSDGALTQTLLEALVFEPYPEVAATLAALRARGEELVALSNWDVSLHDVLRSCGLHDLIDRVLTSAELGAAKPDRRIFEAALAGTAPAAATHVGDSVAEDVTGALACGITPVLLLRKDTNGLLAPGSGGEAPPGVRVIAALDELL